MSRVIQSRPIGWLQAESAHTGWTADVTIDDGDTFRVKADFASPEGRKVHHGPILWLVRRQRPSVSHKPPPLVRPPLDR